MKDMLTRRYAESTHETAGINKLLEAAIIMTTEVNGELPKKENDTYAVCTALHTNTSISTESAVACVPADVSPLSEHNNIRQKSIHDDTPTVAP